MRTNIRRIPIPLFGVVAVLIILSLFFLCYAMRHRTWELENGIISGDSIVLCDDAEFPGTRSLLLKNPYESVSISIEVGQDDWYRLFLSYRLPESFGQKEQLLSVDGGADTAVMFPVSESYTEIPVGIYHLTAGKHTVTVTSSWGWMYVDYFRAEPFTVPRFSPEKAALSNPDSSPAAKKVYRWICENFGKKFITAQQESTWRGSPDYEMDLLQEWTGKYPAIRGLDYMNADFDGVNRRALAWWNRGGLVTICWHTGRYGGGYDKSQAYVWNFERLLTEGTPEHDAMIENWDHAARALSELRDAGVVVLWRPFHEFDGRWFWWGRGTPDQFIRLWRMMYRRYTEQFHLDNLIWVLGFSGTVNPEWYVGDSYCDIIGSDTYNESDNAAGWSRLLQVPSKNKPFAYHECGIVPPLSDFKRDRCLWSWFMIWHTDWLLENDPYDLKTLYNQPETVTLDLLPSFSAQ